ncbi:hypothetical protein EJB05_34012 [Eragrostis curvula]|uniref:F-box associated domain-containing protein n=1 Tax=Eragrostis curvula TaxID=38414 RepID=A0A5J9U467_9POAL|nr:hypothetical protein EJB05_34012 [Eragrostis curvula]
MYFMCESGFAILRYDLHGGEGALSGIYGPDGIGDMLHEFGGTPLLLAGGDGGLIYAGLASNSLHLWSLEMMGTDGDAAWTPLRVFELGALLPNPLRWNCTCLIGTAPGADESDMIFVGTDIGIFAIGLKPRWFRMVRESPSHDHTIFPYQSFLTPGVVARCGD